MSKPRDNRHKDLFRPSLDEIIDLGHPLVRLAVNGGVKSDHGAAQKCTSLAG